MKPNKFLNNSQLFQKVPSTQQPY